MIHTAREVLNPQKREREMSVFLNNLDDFITPSQACINPLVANKLKDSQEINGKSGSGSGSGNTKITLVSDFSISEFESLPSSLSSSVRPDLIKTKIHSENKKKVATVSLNDCLACR